MKKFKGTKKIIALLLSLSLITGMMPAMAWNAFAAEGDEPIDAAIIFSDLHTNKSDYKESTVKGIFTALKNTGLPFSSVTSAGDAFSVNADSGKYTGYTSTITGYIQAVMGNIPVNYVWSDHDRYAVQEDDRTLLSNDSGMIYGAGGDGLYGTNDDANYYIYSLSMADLSTNNRYNADFHTDTEVTAAIADFSASVVNLKKDRPLFIASHQPLFDRRNDNGHAAEWFAAINEVAKGMDVAFFFGHNHNYDQSADYFYAKGETMPVCQKDYSAKNEVLNFTHMCAGYLAPSSTGSTSNTTRQGTAMAITIYDDSINYTTYNSSGVYTGNYALNETVTREFAAKEVAKELTGITVTAPNKVTYNVGEELDTTGMVVTAKYSDDSTETVTDYEVSTVDMSTAGTKEVTVTYEGKTSKFNITVTSTNQDEEIPEGTDIVLPENETATGSSTSTTTTTKTVYVLNSGTPSGNVLIANRNTAGTVNLVANDGGELSNTSGTVVYGDCDGDGDIEYYIELTDTQETNSLWTVAGSYTFENQDEYLRYNRGLTVSGSSTTWSYSNNRLSYRSGSRTYYFMYSNGWTTTTNNGSATSIYFYVPTEVEVETTTTVSGIYSIKGQGISVMTSAGATADLTSTLTFTPESGAATTTNVSTSAKYEIVTVDANGNTVDGDPNNIISKFENGQVTFTGNYGKAYVKVSYTTDYGVVTDYITVEAKAPYYTIQLHEVELEEAIDVTADNFDHGTYYTYNSTTGFYSVATEYVDGTIYYVNNAKQGDEITATVALKGIEAGDTYPVWAVVKKHDTNNPDGKDMGALGDELNWTVSDESIAKIDTATGVLTFTGNNYGTFKVTVSYEGADGKVITDTITISATESLYVVPGDGTNDFPEYPNEGAVRFDKTASAVGNFSETGIAQVEISMTGVPYTKNNRMDVVLMLDRSSSMYKSGVQHRISSTVEATKAFVENVVKNEDGSFNDNRIMVMDFLGGNLNSSAGGGSNHKYQSNLYTTSEDDGYQVINNQAELDALLEKIETDFKGQTTLYGTEYAQGLKGCYDALQASKADGNKQFCVFMSDGIPNYLQGETTHFESTNDIVAMFDVTNRTAANGTASRNATKYEYEHYSNLMKNDGVTVFTVGLGLKNTNSAWNGTSAEVCEQVANMLLNDISGPAGETAAARDTGSAVSKLDKYFFSVADENAAADMKNVFTGIASVIKEAATDVVVEDKIGNNYDMNFSLPGYGTEDALGADALDGLSEFYVQVVEYKLDANKARTEEYAVLENFTFNQDGTFKSHTVGGVACSNCTHVTASAGKVTAIDGTYFDYKSDDSGEYITWEADKLTDKELALQYFAYLNGSSGVSPEKQLEAGTYYTNEYATLTYTNYNGNKVQQEFPVPQMTWNGAQVSYVFYLVNEAGQPVNRAGRVVPFSEALYVTDVFTKAVVWNDLEQLASLDAKYEAAELVPEVYELYDNDAKFNIHVYEDQNEVNLNNHFVIDGDVTDEYNTSHDPAWNNAGTTYVFNSKSGIKYNEFGTYSTGTEYLCKGEGTISNVVFTEQPNVTLADFAKATYYKNVNGTYVRELYYTEDTTYYKLTGVKYDPATGETQAPAADMESTTGGTVIGNYVYYVDENGKVYTIVKKTNGIATGASFDYSNATVAFAVVWKPQLEPDTVVVDYGLDVVVDVIENDAMAAGVTGVMSTAPNAEEDGTYDTDAGVESFTGGNGLWTASRESMTSVRFEQNEIGLKEPVKFYYEAGVNYYKPGETAVTTTNMYSSVTVIPATTIYYEDNFVDFKVYDKGENGWAENTAAIWDTAGTAKNATQETDRPGQNDPVMGSSYDAENVYGYDGAYDNMSTYSMGSSRMLNVDANRYGTAEFEFWGTGFDVIALTSNDTGTITVQVQKIGEDGNLSKVKNMVVDTYYGYTKNDKGEWVVDPTAKNPLYQVPVIESELGEYDHYKVTIKAAYNTIFDHVEGSDNYDMYIDAIRIYDPANDGVDSEIVREAYEKDGEGWPTYVEVRDLLIEKAELDKAETVNGIVFIDGVEATTNVADYKSYGPNNEVYLAENQSIAFDLELPTTGVKVKDVQIGLKSADGNTVSYSVSGKTGTLKTATGMYYSILDKADDTIVITNTSGGILSVTDVKITYESDTYAIEEAATPQTMFRVSKATIASANEIMTEDPKVLSVKTDKDSYEVGETITVTVKTNTEAEYVTVNGVKVTSFTEDGDIRSWTFTQNAATGGKLNYFVEAFNGLGESAQAKAVTVVVEEPEQEEPETPPVVEEPEEPAPAPAKIISLKTDKQNYVQGDKVKVTVTTNKVATKVKVGNKVLKNFTAKNGNRTWTTTVNATKLGKLTIGAIAYNSKGTATKKVTKVVKVKKFAPRIFKVTLNKNKVKKGQKYTVTVKAGSSVKHVRVNGKKITKFTTKKGVKTFKVTFKAKKLGKQKVKVIAYNKALYPSNPKFRTVTVTRK